jgi:hypothetical protein
MHRRLVIVSFCCLAGCSSMPKLFPVTAEASRPLALTESAASAVPAESVDISELDNGMICRSQRRPGSRIAETFCYTREEHAARAEQRAEHIEAYLNALDRDQRNREIAQQQMEQERRRRVTQMR